MYLVGVAQLLSSALLFNIAPKLEAAYATRYWDCCKPHCSWTSNLFAKVQPISTCNKDDVKQSDPMIPSACGNPGQDSAFTCYDNIPFKVTDTLAYGWAAVPATGDMCGKCYQLTFTGNGKYAANPGAAALKGKSMIVQASNIGHDVAGDQFDIMIPGGGVGAFDACTFQWGVQTSQLGAQYGGFLTQCQQQHGHDAPHDTYKACLRQHCQNVFGSNQLTTLHAGCLFFVDWFEVADNPELDFQEVACPAELVQISGMARTGNPPSPSPTPKPSPSPAPPSGDCVISNCGCSWATKDTCATDDGSACNQECCCQFRQTVTNIATTTVFPVTSAVATGTTTINTCTATDCVCNWATRGACATNDGSKCNQECCCQFRVPEASATTTTAGNVVVPGTGVVSPETTTIVATAITTGTVVVPGTSVVSSETTTIVATTTTTGNVVAPGTSVVPSETTSIVATTTTTPGTSVVSSETTTIVACTLTNCACNWATAFTCATDDGTKCNQECCCKFRQATDTTPTTTTNAKVCNKYCRKSTKTWWGTSSKQKLPKCSWKSCSGCIECESPPQPRCIEWCTQKGWKRPGWSCSAFQGCSDCNFCGGTETIAQTMLYSTDSEIPDSLLDGPSELETVMEFEGRSSSENPEGGTISLEGDTTTQQEGVSNPRVQSRDEVGIVAGSERLMQNGFLLVSVLAAVG